MAVDVREAPEREWKIRGKERKSERMKAGIKRSLARRDGMSGLMLTGCELKKEWGNHLPIRVDRVRNRIEVHVPIGKIPGARWWESSSE